MKTNIPLPRGKRGRPKNTVPRVRWTLTLPEPIAAPWELLFTDPIIGRARQNSRNAIIGEVLKALYLAWSEGRNTLDISHINQMISAKVNLPIEEPTDEND